jgi:hypothetical protein
MYRSRYGEVRHAGCGLISGRYDTALQSPDIGDAATALSRSGDSLNYSPLALFPQGNQNAWVAFTTEMEAVLWSEKHFYPPLSLSSYCLIGVLTCAGCALQGSSRANVMEIRNGYCPRERRRFVWSRVTVNRR